MDEPVRIREDIYPSFAEPARSRVINGYISIAYNSISELFDSRNDMIEYINKLENPGIAELFLEVGRFYQSAKYYSCPNCWEKIKRCSSCGRVFEMPSFIVLTIIISIMEKLSRNLIDYIDFKDWASKREIKRRYQEKINSEEISTVTDLIEEMKAEYHENYGSTTKVTQFFNEFLTNNDKFNFIRSIRYMKKVPDLPPRFPKIEDIKTYADIDVAFQEIMREQYEFSKVENIEQHIKDHKIETIYAAFPICFDEQDYLKCYSRDFYGNALGFCHYNGANCPLIDNEELINKYFERTIKTIYEWRSKFVHGDRYHPISEFASLGDFYEGEHIFVELTTHELKPIFEKMVKRYFDRFVEDDS